MNVNGDVEARFWAKVDVSDPSGCWYWRAATRRGYGRFSLPGRRLVQAHRFAFESLVGPVPDGLVLDHLCRNRSCVNPAHLEPVTSAENTRRGEGISAQRARATKCSAGHPFTPENTYMWKGYRHCRTCRAAHNWPRGRSDVEALLTAEPQTGAAS